MKINLRPSLVACAIAAFAVAGCEAGVPAGQGDMSPDVELARQVLAQSCEIGVWRSGGFYSGNDLYVRHGKVDKSSAVFLYRSTLSIEEDRVYVHSLQSLDEGWLKADASYEGTRENLYFNKQTGEFSCSTDEWRAVHAVPQSRSFEVSPLITSAQPNTTAK